MIVVIVVTVKKPKIEKFSKVIIVAAIFTLMVTLMVAIFTLMVATFTFIITLHSNENWFRKIKNEYKISQR
jgi:hypothetical protein